ncbi:hypothetical protein N656DRAFT_543730 [Canariomyces notabilis]|uniref:Uncharacterized protein n=1 Tax=Canariomyces notabilis TaxID=2074819 RepID=A0AAN6YUP7_9PEZI|nr:hypothetical protein N656DRAFT_543730 [Canariomyces arenarius]
MWLVTPVFVCFSKPSSSFKHQISSLAPKCAVRSEKRVAKSSHPGFSAEMLTTAVGSTYGDVVITKTSVCC